MNKQRYSIIPGDFAEDARADVAHFRVLNLIGRHTDAYGWCRMKQITIGDMIGLCRKTVNVKLKELVAWGYVQKHAQDATGRAIYYRVLMDRHGPPLEPVSDDDDDDGGAAMDPGSGGAARAAPSDGPVTRRLQVGYNPGGTCNPQAVTPGVTARGYNKIDPSLTTEISPPSPPPGGRGCVEKFSAGRQGGRPDDAPAPVEALLAAVATTPERRRAVDQVLGPVVRQRTFVAPNTGYALGCLADWIARVAWTPEEAAVIVRGVLDRRKATVKPADIEDAVKGTLAARAKGVSITRTGDPEACAAWAAHAAAHADDPSAATIGRLLARHDCALVPSRWPPGHEPPTPASPATRGGAPVAADGPGQHGGSP